MMKKIAECYNAHIVNMVGCVTVQEPLCLITEFLPYGDLLTYLKYQRKKVSTHIIVCPLALSGLEHVDGNVIVRTSCVDCCGLYYFLLD